MDTGYFGAHALARRLRLGRLASPSPHLGSVEGASMLGFAPGGGRLVLAGARSGRAIVVVLTNRTESGQPEPKVLRGLITILAERRRPSRWCKQCPPELAQTLNANTDEVAKWLATAYDCCRTHIFNLEALTSMDSGSLSECARTLPPSSPSRPSMSEPPTTLMNTTISP